MTDIIALMAFIVGTTFGSLMNVVAYRTPLRASLWRPRSHCTSCQASLHTADLIPIFSWLGLLGRCRRCRAPIPIHYPLLELLTGTLWAIDVWTVPGWPARLTWAVFWLLVMAAVGTDLTAMVVPNQLTYPGAIAVVALSGWSGVQSWEGAVAGAAAGFVLILAVHLLSGGNMGLGDAKLYLSVGAVLGAVGSVESFVIASCFGAVVGLFMRAQGWLKKREHIPFVPYIAMGTVVTAVYGNALTAWYIHHVLGV